MLRFVPAGCTELHTLRSGVSQRKTKVELKLQDACCGSCLQDALSDATNTERSEAEKEGIKFFNYKIDSPVSVM
jgi:hypothetical protein